MVAAGRSFADLALVATVPFLEELDQLTFREELHAIEAVIAGQGIAICDDLLVAEELRNGRLIKALDSELPGAGWHISRPWRRPRERAAYRPRWKSAGSWRRKIMGSRPSRMGPIYPHPDIDRGSYRYPRRPSVIAELLFAFLQSQIASCFGGQSLGYRQPSLYIRGCRLPRQDPLRFHRVAVSRPA